MTADNLHFIDELITHRIFADGAATTRVPTKSVKHNLQLELARHPKRDDFLRRVNYAQNDNQMVRSAALPKRLTMPLISKYEKGMAFNLVMKENPQSEALQMLQRAQTNRVRRWSES